MTAAPDVPTGSGATGSGAARPAAATPPSGGTRRHHRRDVVAGWLFTLPVIVILGVFLVVPVLMAAWVSVSDWTGRGSPFASGVSFIGTQNYEQILAEPGLQQRDFGISLRNNLYYVLLVVPLQTILSLLLATAVNRRAMRGVGFFRTAFYFPSVTSSVAITVLWLFLFSATGPVNKVISFLGLHGPNWFQDPRGLVHVIAGWFGIEAAPAALSEPSALGVTGWEWLAGPSVAMSAFIAMAVFTTSGTFMLLFLAALQALDPEVDEAAMMDGANRFQRFTRITVPQLRPTLFTVITLGLIGTWQVFDQIYTGTQGGPSKTTLTPAYLSYTTAFEGQRWGQGAAISFLLFFLIVLLTLLQRWVLRERDGAPRGRRARAATPEGARA